MGFKTGILSFREEVTKRALGDRRITDAAFRVLVAMLGHVNGEEYKRAGKATCWPGIERLADQLGKNQATIKRAVALLVEIVQLPGIPVRLAQPLLVERLADCRVDVELRVGTFLQPDADASEVRQVGRVVYDQEHVGDGFGEAGIDPWRRLDRRQIGPTCLAVHMGRRPTTTTLIRFLIRVIYRGNRNLRPILIKNAP